MDEKQAIERLRKIATDPAARGLLDDAAVLNDLVLTHDTIAEGVHFLPSDPPASVGWKLVTVNLSDLAAKGAEPLAALMSLSLVGESDWEERFLDGVEAACESYRLPLVGGDTIALPPDGPRVLGLTAIGRAGKRVPARSGARAGDRLWLAGTVGDAALGLMLLEDDPRAEGPLVEAYRRPIPLLAAGRILAAEASAMMDVSDGLLIDARRLAEASGVGATIDMDSIPLSEAFVEARGETADARMFAATGGDDYALLIALPPEIDPLSLPLPSRFNFTCVGTLVDSGPSLSLTSGGSPVSLPERLGFEHRSNSASPVADRP